MEIISAGNETFSQHIAEVSAASIRGRTVIPSAESTASRIVPSYNNRGRQCDFDFYVKLPLLITSTVCAALQTTIPTTTENDYIAYLPRVIFFEFTLLNAYIILNYRWWSKQKKTMKQLYGICGCLLYLSAGVIVIMNRAKFFHPGNLSILQPNITRRDERYRQKRADTMTSIGFLAFWEAILHSLDAIIWSF